MSQHSQDAQAQPPDAAARPAPSANAEAAQRPERQPYRVRLPGFLAEADIGLGDAIKRATYAVGIKPCGGCSKRAAALNRWVTFGPGRRR